MPRQDVLPLDELIAYLSTTYEGVDVATYPPGDDATARFFSRDAQRRTRSSPTVSMPGSAGPRSSTRPARRSTARSRRSCVRLTIGSADDATDPPYLDDRQRGDRRSGGVQMIAISAPKGDFRVWTRRFGNNGDIKLLFLHGGPGATHEYFEVVDSYLPAAGVEYYFYDQLGSFYSDRPDDPQLWEIDRFVDEVEQVRRALRLDRSNFYLLGHSWGGILAMEYARR